MFKSSCHPAYLPALVIIISVPSSKKRCHKSLICSSIVMSSHSNVSVDPTRLCMACIEPSASVATSEDREGANDEVGAGIEKRV